MKVGVLHTAFVGDLANCGKLIEGLFREEHEIVFFTNRGGAALFRNDRRLASLVTVEKKRGIQKISQIWKIAAQLRSEKLDVLLVPHRSSTSALISFLSGVPTRVGFARSTTKWTFTNTTPYEPSLHECDRILALAQEVGLCREFGSLPEDSRNFMDSTGGAPDFLKRFPFLSMKNATYFVVSPGSVWPTKRYPISSFAEVIRGLLLRFPKACCVISGSPAELDLAKELIECVRSAAAERVLNGVGAIPLWELPAVLSGALFSISNDSGPLHVACGVGSPVVGIYGPTSDETGLGPIGPRSAAVKYGNEHAKPLSCQPCSKHGHKICPAGHFRCMKDLSPKTIIEAVLRVVG